MRFLNSYLMDTYRSEIVLKCGKIENKDAAILNIASKLGR